MKLASFFILLLVSFSALSQEIILSDYKWSLTEISELNLSKEKVFQEMDKSFIKIDSAICSNSAHMWANDLKRKYDIQSGKIFVFFTKKNSEDGLKTWWYHASTLINEHGTMWVLDGGYPYSIKGPLSIEGWFSFFAKTTTCKEIDSSEIELIELMFKGQVYPQTTKFGKNDCYYKITPHTIWTPTSLAESLLGRDENGRDVKVDWQEINKNELYQACLESTTTKLTYHLNSSKYHCRKYVEK
jgi:hypothetical protein